MTKTLIVNNKATVLTESRPLVYKNNYDGLINSVREAASITEYKELEFPW